MRNSCKIFMVLSCAFAILFCSNSIAAEAETEFNYEDYAFILNKFVDNAGMVNYKKLKEDHRKLDIFVLDLKDLNKHVYDSWDPNSKLAFWINAYNGLTLKVVIDHYPIKSSLFKSQLYPKNSIKQIPGAWNRVFFRVMGKKMTLHHIEHNILRKEFNEPRIHMAIVCAAKGCPRLYNKPYSDQKLEEQLENQAKLFFTNIKNFRINRKKRTVFVSPILKWFAMDFARKEEKLPNIKWKMKNDSATLRFAAKYVEKTDAEFLLNKFTILLYQKYDWSLNEQPEKKKGGRKPNHIEHLENNPILKTTKKIKETLHK